MSTEVKPLTEGTQSAEKKVITQADWIQRRTQKPEKAEEKKQEVQKEPEPEVNEKTKEVEPDAQKAEAEKKEVLSKELDIDSLSDEDIAELAQKGKSGLLKRIAELTAKRKLAEERAAAAEAKLNTPVDPLKTERKDKNPYADVKTIEDLRVKTQDVEEVIEWAEDILFQYDGAPADEPVTKVNGQEVTKAQVRKALKDAQKARKEYLPAQLQAIQAREQRKAAKVNMDNLARKELPWMEGDNDTKKEYQKLRSDPLFAEAIEKVPGLEPYLDYLTAHATNSVYGRKEISIDVAKPKTSPPSNPGSNTAKAEAPETRGSAKMKELQDRFKKTKTPEDFQKLRAAQFATRQNLSI